jgi:steroid 5-alpha reductase family enzyme
MLAISVYLQGLGAIAALAFCTWALSMYQGNVAIVDSLWGLMFASAAYAYAYAHGAIVPLGPRATLILSLVSLWAVRLSIYITWRNRGQGEDRRYQAIRIRNQPNFALKSLYLVFALQAALAWFISLPLLGAILSFRPLTLLDFGGAALWAVGIIFEAGGDWQLARFKADPANRGRVMTSGFWRFTRHPNYFGDFCVWWGLYCIAAAGGAWWSIGSPIVMSVLLIRVSGVALLEKDIAKRRPEYADYARRTRTFFPWIPKRSSRGADR